MAAGVVGIIFAIVMEVATGEPVYWLVMKVTAGLFGVGGPLFGLAIARRGNRMVTKCYRKRGDASL